jgi:hypothetical protein
MQASVMRALDQLEKAGAQTLRSRLHDAWAAGKPSASGISAVDAASANLSNTVPSMLAF